MSKAGGEPLAWYDRSYGVVCDDLSAGSNRSCDGSRGSERGRCGRRPQSCTALLMNGNDPMWFSRMDIFAVIAALVLGIIYFLGGGTRDWIATALSLMLTFWILSKLEQVYLTNGSDDIGAGEERPLHIEAGEQVHIQPNSLQRLKVAFRRRPTTHIVMATCASLYALACLVLHQEIILIVAVLTAISFSIVGHFRRRRGPRSIEYLDEGLR